MFWLLNSTSTDSHIGFNRHAWTKLVLWILTRVDVNPNWKTLDDLHVVATGIFGREEPEQWPRSACQVFDGAVIIAPETINMNGDGFSGLHTAELCLFEVCGDPDVINRNDCKQCLTRLNAIPNLDGFVPDNATYRSVDRGVAEVQLRRANICPCLLQSTIGRGEPCASVRYLLGSCLRCVNLSLTLRDCACGLGNLAFCGGL